MHFYKVVVFGSPVQSIGKTQLLSSWLLNRYSDRYDATMGAFLQKKQKHPQLEIWDTPGQERLIAFTRLHFRNTNIGIYCIDLSKKLKKEQIESDILEFKRQAGAQAKLVLVGTKADAAFDIESASDELGSIAQRLKYPYFVTSAKNKEGFAELDQEISKLTKEIQISFLQELLAKIRENAQKLSPPKRLSLENKLEKLQENLAKENDIIALGEYLDEFVTDCRSILSNKHPDLMTQILKLVAIITVSVLVGALGFGVGFALGLWTGPAAFISAFATGSASAYLVATGGGVSAVMSGGLMTYTLFKSPKLAALEKGLMNQVEEIQHAFTNQLSAGS